MSDNDGNGAIPARRLPPGWSPPEPPAAPAAEPAALRDGTDTGAAADSGEGAAAQTAPPNLFVLPGLPTYAGMEVPAEDADPQDQNDDQPSQTAIADGAYSGEWSEWLGPGETPADKAPADPDAGTADDDDYDAYDAAARDEANPYVVPDYNDATAMAAFRDRTGGRAVRPAMSHEKVTGRGRSASPVWRIVGGTLAVAATAAAIGVVIVVNLNAAKDGPVMPGGDPAAAGSTSTVRVTSALPVSWDHATPGCTRTRSSSLTIGADPGSHNSPEMAILGFEWAYYVDRDAHAARSFTTPDAKVSAVEKIQEAIDTEVPEGTRYCVYITAGDSTGKVWDVELHEQRPTDPEPVQIGQRITTTIASGKALITAIDKQ